MCGRYSFFTKDEVIESRFKASFMFPIQRHYNAAPSQLLPIILNNDPEHITAGKWGLTTSWMNKKGLHPLINARVETVSEKPSFKQSFSKRRCLVIADNFFEWSRQSNIKIPFRILLKDEQPFAFAGIFELLKLSSGVVIPTFTIITVPANELVAPLHDRMPAILSKDHESLWIDPKAPYEAAKSVCKPYAEEKMKMYEVSPLVNSVKHDEPRIIQPIQKLL
ncbi:SOS response-associated peptidase [Patescibacteria group bacterium]